LEVADLGEDEHDVVGELEVLVLVGGHPAAEPMDLLDVFEAAVEPLEVLLQVGDGLVHLLVVSGPLARADVERHGLLVGADDDGSVRAVDHGGLGDGAQGLPHVQTDHHHLPQGHTKLPLILLGVQILRLQGAWLGKELQARVQLHGLGDEEDLEELKDGLQLSVKVYLAAEVRILE